MKTNIHFNETIRVNGRAYNSVDELPAELRAQYERVVAAMQGGAAAPGGVTAKVTVNGREYASLAEVPPLVRKLYEDVLGAKADLGAPAQPSAPSGVQESRPSKRVLVAFLLLLAAALIFRLLVAARLVR